MFDNPVLFGALFGVGGTVIGVVLGFVLNTLLGERLRARVTRRRMAAALHAEAVANLARYMKAIGAHLRDLKPGEPVSVWGPAVEGQNFFAVYDGNTDKLGLFSPEDARAIVDAYTKAKGHIESLNQTGRAMQAGLTLISTRDWPANVQAHQALDKVRAQYGQALKEESLEVVSAGENAIRILARYAGIKEEKGDGPG